MALTQLQAKMLKKMATHECNSNNGAEPQSEEDVNTWADQIIETAEDKGVFTSLLKAGLVWHSGGPKRDAGVGFTAEGFAEYKAL